MRADIIVAVATALGGCSLKDGNQARPVTSVSWVAAGMGHCHALSSTPRGTVVAACDRGVVETGVDGQTHTLHPTLSHDISTHAGMLWVKLPDTLLWGKLPQAGTVFASTKRQSLGTIDDMLTTPDGRLVVATPGTLVRVSPDTGTISRFRKVPVPMEKLALGAPASDGSSTLLAIARDAVYAVEKTRFRMEVGGLSDVQAAVTLPDGRLVVASGSPTTLGVLNGSEFAPTQTRIEGLTDLVVHNPGSGPELWFTTNDGSIGRAPLP